MARPKPSFMPQTRILTSPHQVATMLGRGEQWFASRRQMLEQAGFPRQDTLLGGWDIDAINAWLDRRAGLEPNCPTDATPNPWDEALGGQGGTALHM